MNYRKGKLINLIYNILSFAHDFACYRNNSYPFLRIKLSPMQISLHSERKMSMFKRNSRMPFHNVDKSVHMFIAKTATPSSFSVFNVVKSTLKQSYSHAEDFAYHRIHYLLFLL